MTSQRREGKGAHKSSCGLCHCNVDDYPALLHLTNQLRGFVGRYASAHTDHYSHNRSLGGRQQDVVYQARLADPRGNRKQRTF